MSQAGAAPQPELAVASPHRNDCGFHCIAHNLVHLPADLLDQMLNQNPIVYQLIADKFFERYGRPADLPENQADFKHMLMYVKSYDQPFDHEILLGPVLRETLRAYSDELEVTEQEALQLQDWHQVAPEVLARFANALGADFHVRPNAGEAAPEFNLNYPINEDGPASPFKINLTHVPGEEKVVNGETIQFGHYDFSYPDPALNGRHNQKIQLEYGRDGNILPNGAELYDVAVGGEDEASRLDHIRESFRLHRENWEERLREVVLINDTHGALREHQLRMLRIATPEAMARARLANNQRAQNQASPPPKPPAAPELEHLVSMKQGPAPRQTQAVDPSADELFNRRQAQSAAPTATQAGPSLTAKPKHVPVTPSAPQTHPPVDPKIIRSKFIDKLRANFGNEWEVIPSEHEINVREKLHQDRNVKITETNDIYKFTAPAGMVPEVARAANTYQEVLKADNEDIEYEIEVGSPAQAREFLRELNQGKVSIEAISTIKVRGAQLAEAEVKALIEEIKPAPAVSNTPRPN